MPLSQPYGVVISTLDHFDRQPVDSFGKWYHGYIYVNTPGGQYNCAVDVSSPDKTRVQYRVLHDLDQTLFTSIQSLTDGWHVLQGPNSGALDYIRSPILRMLRSGCIFGPLNSLFDILRAAVLALIFGSLDRQNPWQDSNGDNALNAMQNVLSDTQRLFIFGAHFINPAERGVHDVHMNQGDPQGSQWYQYNGIFQDGISIGQKHDGELVAFLVRFDNQSLNTDANGNPA